MFIQYKEQNFRRATLATIHKANEIIDAYAAEGYTLTLRQLYYQFISIDYFPNTKQSYDKLGTTMTNARLHGLTSWTAIEDRNRGVENWVIEEDQQAVLDNIEFQFGYDFWQRQNIYIECWVEKDAMSGVIEKACQPYRVPYMACKGYLSASEAWRAGQRYEAMRMAGRRVILLHLGDHDPSGIDMTRDNSERLELFSDDSVEVKRLALNMNQIEELKPPPNPTKITDTRAGDYIKRFGSSSWELDALKPGYIVDLIQSEIKPLIDWDEWNRVQALETEHRKELAALHDNWPEVKKFVSKLINEQNN
jgi:hypothetical protein